MRKPYFTGVNFSVTIEKRFLFINEKAWMEEYFMDKLYDYLLNKVFTIPYLDKMIDGTNVDTFIKCVSRYVNNEELTYGEAISKIYHHMDISYRNEYYFKNTILNQLLIKKHDLYNTVALTELPIADSKADFILINGKGVVYEIKTDLDNFSRLENQILDYYKAFKYVNVVVGYKQYEKVRVMLENSKVGIFVLGKNGNLYCRKKAKCNDKQLSFEVMFRILRKKEYESILLKHYGMLPEVNNFYYYRECLKWVKKINIKTFQKDMIQCLKQRMHLIVENVFEKNIPYELRFYAYFSKKNSYQNQTINVFWNKKLEV